MPRRKLTHRAIALARAADASVYIVHLSCADALAEVVDGQGAGLAGLRRDVPALPDPDRGPIRPARRGARSSSRSSRRPSGPTRTGRRMWLGLRARWAGPGRQRPRPGSAGRREARARPAVPADQQRRAGDRDAARRSSTPRAWPSGRITVERMVDLLATTPARLFGLPTKGAIEVGRDADLVLLRPCCRSHHPPGRSPPHQRLHPVRGLRRSPAPVRTVHEPRAEDH